MAILADSERVNAWVDFLRDESSDSQSIACLKADVRAAINAADDWANSNQSSYNLALPQPARGALTTRQKTRILMFVLERRYLTGV